MKKLSALFLIFMLVFVVAFTAVARDENGQGSGGNEGNCPTCGEDCQGNCKPVKPPVDENVFVGYHEAVKNTQNGVNAVATATKTSVNTLTVTVTEAWTKETTIYEVWSISGNKLSSEHVEDYEVIMTESIIIGNGTYTATYTFFGYVVFVRVQGNDLVEYYIVNN